MCFDAVILSLRRPAAGIFLGMVTTISYSVVGRDQDASGVCFETYINDEEMADTLVLLRIDDDESKMAPICRQDGVCIDDDAEFNTELINASSD